MRHGEWRHDHPPQVLVSLAPERALPAVAAAVSRAWGGALRAAAVRLSDAAGRCRHNSATPGNMARSVRRMHQGCVGTLSPARRGGVWRSVGAEEETDAIGT